uniref:LTA synthase family protein n=2 Tax=Flavobacterium sp. TaxID=239 RepID=UPI0040491887
MKLLSTRFAVPTALSLIFIILSFVLRLALLIWVRDEFSFSFLNLILTFLIGFSYDLGIVSFFWLFYSFYFLLIPTKFVGSLFDKTIVYFFTQLFLIILVFVFFAEITFFEEFKSRFNFVAVDYLIYTFEVIQNINQSYPLIILIPAVLLIGFLMAFGMHKKGYFKATFSAKTSFTNGLQFFGISLLAFAGFVMSFQIDTFEWSSNRYNNEISKAGIHAFFSAMKTETLDYATFYTTMKDYDAFKNVHESLNDSMTNPNQDFYGIKRDIIKSNTAAEARPNVVLIMIESMSGSFMKEFGNKDMITPYLDQVAKESMFFSNMYATGTRTVRGMEAVMLSIPPTPGSSIVKRPNNQDLFTIGHVFKDKNYRCNFFYGGDGYFDNMNAFFGGNGFNIYDRNRGSILTENIPTEHHVISEEAITFENAWGICDEDIYAEMLKIADAESEKGLPFFNFIMTTSNHRPYTYPDNKIDIPSGTSRNGAVKYSDFALEQFMKKAQEKPWFDNTIFVFVADHCASSAGKDEIDVKNYHIPAMIYGKSIKPQKIDKLVSQIDLMPTLFGALNWSYTSDFFGQDVLSSHYQPRAYLGTYLKLSYMVQDDLIVLSNHKNQSFYHWNKETNVLSSLKMNPEIEKEAIANYQTAAYLFSHQKLH